MLGNEMCLFAANLPAEALEQLPSSFESGIYFGWATVDGAGPYKMVASVGCKFACFPFHVPAIVPIHCNVHIAFLRSVNCWIGIT
jgi:hypothetical protein